MRIRQYCYFAINSPEVTDAEITARLLIEPDHVLVKGSRRTNPRQVPVWHGWDLRCEAAGLAVDEQLDLLLDRLEPSRAAIAGYLDELRADSREVSVRLQVVRDFDDDEGEEEELTEVGGAVKLGGQHQLLGWHLGPRVLDFLAAMRAELDVDEYG